MHHNTWTKTKVAMTAALVKAYGPGYLDGADWVRDGESRTHATVRCEVEGTMLVQPKEGEQWSVAVPEIAPA